MLTLAHVPLEPGCEALTFLNKAVKGFEHVLDSFLLDSVNTLKGDASFDEPDAITSSVSLGFLWLASTFQITLKLQLSPDIRFHELLSQTRVVLSPVSFVGKMSASEPYLAAFGYKTSTLLVISF